MKKIIVGISTTLLLDATTFAQTTSTKDSTTSAISGKATKSAAASNLGSAVTLTGQLQGSLNAEKAKVGDEVVLKITKGVKENGVTVIEKGARLVGRITDVKQKTKDRAGSEIAVFFDKLRDGSDVTPVAVTILSVTRLVSSSSSRTVDVTFAMDSSRPSTIGTATSTRGQAGSTTTTASGVENTPRNIAGTSLDTSGRRGGSAKNTVETNIRGLHVDRPASATANGSTTLGMNTGNLKLDSQTIFTVKVEVVANTTTN